MLARIRRKKALLSDRAAAILGLLDDAIDVVEDIQEAVTIVADLSWNDLVSTASKAGINPKGKKKEALQKALRKLPGYR